MPVAPCPTPCPPVTRGVVVFSPTEFVAQYPEFAGLANNLTQAAFNDAVFLLSNSCGSIVQDANQRLILLYTLTAHCCFLENGSNDGNGNIVPAPNANVVGRLSSATEGSVSAALELNSDAGGPSEAYFTQTKYGFKYWQQTAPYRTMHYVGAPAVGPNGPGFPWAGNNFEIE